MYTMYMYIVLCSKVCVCMYMSHVTETPHLHHKERKNKERKREKGLLGATTGLKQGCHRAYSVMYVHVYIHNVHNNMFTCTNSYYWHTLIHTCTHSPIPHTWFWCLHNVIGAKDPNTVCIERCQTCSHPQIMAVLIWSQGMQQVDWMTSKRLC